jgi:hypothetical protein
VTVPVRPERETLEALRAELARKDRLLQMIVDDNYLLGRSDNWERLAVRHIVTARAALSFSDTHRPAEGESRRSGRESALLGQADRAGGPGVKEASTHDCKPHGRPPLPGPENPVGVCDLCGYDEGER